MSHEFIRHLVLTAVLTTNCAIASAAEPPQFVTTAASKVSSVAAKVENSVKHGLQKGASAVERGASATGRAVNKTAKKLGLPTTPASSASE
ncbi:hypothetical protein [Aquabacterium sp. CECT 9606]|uniref:hypothetical protein n=1 Tax=Aquabacterium sp. CECT 9606 TaxID=2845822 RepID=UPI001E36B81E|nr:hypothetical protein [Aquabacterium sp. CECT 9606]CAH0350120.1 hypothetical protein AQB9606_01415 [Aquabacterium sp. CECT 9606]